MYCNKCGNKIVEGSKFCAECGQELTDHIHLNSSITESKKDIDNFESNNNKQVIDNVLEEDKINNDVCIVSCEEPNYKTASTLTMDNIETIESNKKMNKSKTKIVIVSSIVVILVIGGFLSYMFLSNTSIKTYESCFNSQKYDEAKNIYDKLMKNPKNKEEIKTFLVDQIDSVKDNFRLNKIKYDEASSFIGQLSKYEVVNSEVAAAKKYVNEVNDSTKAYEDGNKNYSDKKYFKALDNFEKVIKDDSNYDDAQLKIKTIMPLAKKESLDKVESYASSKDYKSAIDTLDSLIQYDVNDSDITSKKVSYEDSLQKQKEQEKKALEEQQRVQQEQKEAEELQKMGADILDFYVINDKNASVPKANITIKNIGSKNIDAIKLTFECYDSFGKPVKGLSSSGNIFSGIIQNDMLQSGDMRTFTWDLINYDLTTKIKNVNVTNVHFTDGSTWGN